MLGRCRQSLLFAFAAGLCMLVRCWSLQAADETTPAVVLPEGYVSEAPLPAGFPPPSEPGVVVEKEYPLARTYSAQGSGAFGKLFAYLVLRQHKMTSPVIIDYTEKEKPKGKDLPVALERMHFVLEQLDRDRPRTLGFVSVGDLAATRVLSIASQGDMSPEAVDAAEEKLRAALAERPELEAAAGPRLLGYNSPEVPSKKRFWELQLPVRERGTVGVP